MLVTQASNLFVVMDDKGVLIIENPEECGYHNPRETVLRIFTSSKDAKLYMATKNGEYKTFKSTKTDLLTVWNLLGHIDDMCSRKYNSHIRIELVSVNKNGELGISSVLRSAYSTRS